MACRSLNFVTLIYPEHYTNESELYENLDSLHCQGILSPLHDRDKKDDGTLKKGHYHLLLMFDSVKTIAQVEDCLNNAHIFYKGLGVCVSKKAYARYLCHLDSPEKAQYSVSDCLFFGGASPHLLDKEIDVTDGIGKMLDYVHTYDFRYWCDLVDFLREHDIDLYNYVSKHTQSFMFTYIKSYSYKMNSLNDSHMM